MQRWLRRPGCLKKPLSVHKTGSCRRACSRARGGFHQSAAALVVIWGWCKKPHVVDSRSVAGAFWGTVLRGVKPSAVVWEHGCLNGQRGGLTTWNNWSTTWAPPAPCAKWRWCQVTSQVTGSLTQVSQRFRSMQRRTLQCKALPFIPLLSPSGEKCRVHRDIYWNVMGKKAKSPAVKQPCPADGRPSDHPRYFELGPSRGSPRLRANPGPRESRCRGVPSPAQDVCPRRKAAGGGGGLAVMLAAGLCFQPGKEAHGSPGGPASNSAPGTCNHAKRWMACESQWTCLLRGENMLHWKMQQSHAKMHTLGLTCFRDFLQGSQWPVYLCLCWAGQF